MTRKQQAGLGQETGPSSRPETVLVRALMPLWAGWELVAPGTVYEQPADAAEAMAALGMVEIVQAGDASADVSMTDEEMG